MKKITTIAALGIAAVVTTAQAEVSSALHGFQFGGHVGYVDGTTDLKTSTVPSGLPMERYDLSTSGVAGGIVLGYSVLSNKMVAGLDGKVTFTGNDGDLRVNLITPIDAKVKQGTSYGLGVKLGAVAFDNTLLYIRPGVVWSNWKVKHAYPASATGRKSKTLTGFAIAAGADWAVNQNFTLGAEYEFATYGDIKYNTLTPANRVFSNGKASPNTSTFSLVAKYALGGMGK